MGIDPILLFKQMSVIIQKRLNESFALFFKLNRFTIEY